MSFAKNPIRQTPKIIVLYKKITFYFAFLNLIYTFASNFNMVDIIYCLQLWGHSFDYKQI